MRGGGGRGRRDDGDEHEGDGGGGDEQEGGGAEDEEVRVIVHRPLVLPAEEEEDDDEDLNYVVEAGAEEALVPILNLAPIDSLPPSSLASEADLLLLLLVDLHNVMSAAEPYRQSACYQIHSTCVNGPALKLLVIIVIKIVTKGNA